jgi:hypothetical protein
MSDQRDEGETVEQYARRLLSDYAGGNVDAALEFSCQYCAGHLKMGLCRAIIRASEQDATRMMRLAPEDGEGRR